MPSGLPSHSSPSKTSVDFHFLSLSLSHRRTHCAKMADTKVETIARLAQWKIEIFGPATPYKRSDPFKIGIWNWYSSICLSNLTLL